MLRIGFYAPLKAPDHPVPSGDRQMARLLVAALGHAGHRVSMVSLFRSFVARPDETALDAIESAADREVDAIAARWTAAPEAVPDLLFTYHLYYKAPDLIGPALAQRFDLPYVTAEASHAGKRADGPWRRNHERVERAIGAAALNVCFTPNDRAGLAEIVADPRRLIDLPPFVDATIGADTPRQAAELQLVTVAMMRPGDKLRSYAFLADALARLAHRDWTLTIVGDGPARLEVEALFAAFPAQRLHWQGAVPAEAIADLMAAADLFVWPGFNEAYGMVYLEAQANGLPVVAVIGDGTPSVIRHGETGLLTSDDPAAYAAALDGLMANAAHRTAMGDAGRAFVRGERTLERAAARLDAGLRGIMAEHAGKRR